MAAKKLTKDEIESLLAADHKVEVLYVPEWNGEVHIRTTSAFDRDAYSQSVAALKEGDRPNMVNFRARLVARCLCDETGKLLYDDPEEGAKILGAGNSAAIDRIFNACRKLNAMGDEALKDFEKN